MLFIDEKIVLEKKDYFENQPLLDGGNPLARKCPKKECQGVAIARDYM